MLGCTPAYHIWWCKPVTAVQSARVLCGCTPSPLNVQSSYFHYPVSAKQLPDYHKVVVNAMDLETMRKVCVHLCANMCACVHVCMCACVRVCACACVYEFIYSGPSL